MKVSELRSKVQDAIQDDSFTDEFILDSFNKCHGELASIYTLPDLMTHTEIICPVGEFKTSLPDTFLKGLDFAYNLTRKEKVNVVKALTTFLAKFPSLDLGPPVDTVCAQGKTMFFQGVPVTEETLRVFFIRNPETMIMETDEPEAVPEHLHEDLFVNYGCAACFNLIEDGMEGAKINFNKYTSLYQQAQVKLEQFFGIPPESPDFIPSGADQIAGDFIIDFES